MSHNPRPQAFIAIMAAACIGSFRYGLSQGNVGQLATAAIVLLALSLASSRMRVKLPGLTGNMSVNLPFLLLAVSQLSLVEAMIVSCATAALQSFKKDWGAPKLEQLIFNISVQGLASAMAWQVFHWGASHHLQSALLVAMAAITFFLVQTLAVSTIIALTDGGAWRKVWTNMALLTFPYFVLSAGVAFMISMGGRTGWRVPLAALPVMFVVFLSYQLYFSVTTRNEQPLAMGARAGR